MTSFPIGLFSPEILMLNKGQVKEILGRWERERSLLKQRAHSLRRMGSKRI
jgi:hypothetical protein